METKAVIKNHVVRAEIVVMLESDQLDRLQSMERAIGYALPPWNICEILSLPTIKERFGIPDEAEHQQNHNRRLEEEIERLKLRVTEPYEDQLEWMHMFSWNVFHRKNEIVWDYSGSNRFSNVKERLRQE